MTTGSRPQVTCCDLTHAHTILYCNQHGIMRPITTSMQYKPDHFFRPIRSDLTSSIPIGRWYLVGFQTGSYLFTLLIYLLLILVIILLLLNIIYFLFFRNHRTSKFPEKSQLHLQWRHYYDVITCITADFSCQMQSYRLIYVLDFSTYFPPPWLAVRSFLSWWYYTMYHTSTTVALQQF